MLHFGLTPEALFGPHESLPWNPLIANVFYRRGIIESWGRGTLKIAELALAAGLLHPEIESTGGCVTVRLLRAALVLFGHSRRLAAEFPQCLLRVARFAGTDKTEFRDARQFRGNTFELLLAAERFGHSHLRRILRLPLFEDLPKLIMRHRNERFTQRIK